MRQRTKIIGLFLCVLPLFMIVGGTILFRQWAARPIPLQNETLITLSKGTSLYSLSDDLEQKGLITSSSLFQIWVRVHRHTYEHFLAGTYRFTDAVRPQEIIETMIEGKTYNPLVLEFTIPEGSTFDQIRTALVALGVGTNEDFLNLAMDKTWLEGLGLQGVEGFLFPAKYSFYNNKPNPQEVLERMIKEFFTRIPADYEEELHKRSLSLEQWVTFASLIERETSSDEERPMISEVIWRRLQAGIALGIDAALIYGIKDFNGDITHEDLQNRKNLYNTRVYRGLPPTPIASPSLASLLAVFNPTNNGYYYFVLVPGAAKRHHFSASFKEHSLYVKELVRAQHLQKSYSAHP